MSERICPAGAGSYIWRQGDTEESVAARYGISVVDLRTMNEGALGDTAVGESICVPIRECPNGTLYVVHRGDTFTSIAAAYGITVAALSTANPFVDPDVIEIGQVLCVPVGGGVNCASGISYTVRRGDTLSAIAARYGTTVAAIVAANGIANANRIEIGQVLCIPTAGGGTGSCLSGITYTVQRGDTLSAIAARYGTNVASIVAANGITNPNRIEIGQVLCMPVGSSTGNCASGVTYTVRRGDTLSAIAARYGVTVAAIVAANGIANANRIDIGQVLCIPTAGGSTGSCAGGVTYTVQRGDTLSAIAARYGVTVAAIVAANGIVNANRIEIGQVLCIPIGGSTGECVGGVSYTVQRGDTLSAIAARYGTAVAAIVAANGIVNPNIIEVGQVLCVPVANPGDDSEIFVCPEGYTSGTVLAGESYADLLIKNNVSYLVFRLANPALAPGLLIAGQTYCVPPATACAACAEGESTYTLVQGETLTSAAERLGVSVGALLRRNPNLAPCDFVEGQTICWA